MSAAQDATRAVSTAFDAMDATRHALKLAHFPDARAALVDLGRVIVEPPTSTTPARTRGSRYRCRRTARFVADTRAHAGRCKKSSSGQNVTARHPRARGEGNLHLQDHG